MFNLLGRGKEKVAGAVQGEGVEEVVALGQGNAADILDAQERYIQKMAFVVELDAAGMPVINPSTGMPNVRAQEHTAAYNKLYQ